MQSPQLVLWSVADVEMRVARHTGMGLEACPGEAGRATWVCQVLVTAGCSSGFSLWDPAENLV